MPTQNMDDFVMKSKWTILHMWIILLGYTGIDPTLCTESTLWYPSSHEKARKLLSEDWLWMGLSWKSSFWSRKLFLQLHVGNKQCIDAFILPNWNCLNYRPTDTDTILEENRKNCRFYRLYMDVWQSSLFLHLSSHYKSP